jgi:ATP-binding protein involved in chromosome partitioning
MARALGLDLLGQVPIVQSIREGGDAGEPVALGSRPDGLAFLEIASKLVGKLEKKD